MSFRDSRDVGEKRYGPSNLLITYPNFIEITNYFCSLQITNFCTNLSNYKLHFLSLLNLWLWNAAMSSLFVYDADGKIIMNWLIDVISICAFAVSLVVNHKRLLPSLFVHFHVYLHRYVIHTKQWIWLDMKASILLLWFTKQSIRYSKTPDFLSYLIKSYHD